MFAGSALPIHRIITKLTWNLGNIMLIAHADFHPNPQFLTPTFSLESVNSCYLPTKPHSFHCGPYGPKLIALQPYLSIPYSKSLNYFPVIISFNVSIFTPGTAPKISIIAPLCRLLINAILIVYTASPEQS